MSGMLFLMAVGSVSNSALLGWASLNIESLRGGQVVRMFVPN